MPHGAAARTRARAPTLAADAPHPRPLLFAAVLQLLLCGARLEGVQGASDASLDAPTF